MKCIMVACCKTNGDERFRKDDEVYGMHISTEMFGRIVYIPRNFDILNITEMQCPTL